MFATSSSHFATVTEIARRFFTRYRPYREAPTSYFLISGGLHDGCINCFKQDNITIGSRPDCDLVLIDDSIANIHAEVKLTHSLLGPLLTIRPLSASLSVGNKLVQAGEISSYEKLPVEILLSDSIKIDIAARDIFSATAKKRSFPILR